MSSGICSLGLFPDRSDRRQRRGRNTAHNQQGRQRHLTHNSFFFLLLNLMCRKCDLEVSFLFLSYRQAGRTNVVIQKTERKKKMDLSGIKRFLRQTDGAAGCRKCVQGNLGGIADASYVCQSRRRSTAKAEVKHITLFVFTQKPRRLQSSGCFMRCWMFPRSAADVLYRTVR